MLKQVIHIAATMIGNGLNAGPELQLFCECSVTTDECIDRTLKQTTDDFSSSLPH